MSDAGAARDGDGDVDVAVIGGGPAGIAAAVAAASTGSSVLLVEAAASLGGNVSQAFVHTICGLYLPSAESVAVPAHPGLPSVFADAMAAAGFAGDVDWAGSAGFLAIDPDGFATTADALCERAGVATWTSARLLRLGAPRDRDDAWRLDLGTAGGGRRAVSAWTVVDTTGDANAAVAAGVSTAIAAPDELQHASFVVRIDGVAAAASDRMERARTSAFAARESKHGRLPAACASIVLRPSTRPGSLFVTMNLPKPAAFDPLDGAMLAALRDDAAFAAAALVARLGDERESFRSAIVGALPARVGIRETRRIAGLSTLGVDDVLAGRRRDDEACVSTWPVELWSSTSRLEFRHPAGPSSIPLGCLVADHPSRRFAMAGRCASASHEALGAVRVIATSMAMGEAVGAACSLAAAVRADLASIDPATLRDLIRSGATTPA